MRRRPVLTATLFLLGLLFIEFPGVLLLRQVPFISEMVAGSDLLTFSYPLRQVLGESLRQGHFPLWTDGINGGFPLHAEGQGGFLYPPNLLLALLPLKASLCLSFVLAYLGAGIALFLYAREIGQSRTGALFAAMTFMFCGFLFSHIRHMNVIASAQWLPLLLLLCERYARTRRPGYLLALAPVQALQHLAGHPQTTYYSALFTVAYLLTRILCWPPAGKADGQTERKGRRALLALFGFAGACLLGAALAGAQLLPSLELMRNALRPTGTDYAQATFHTLPLLHLVTFLSPFFLGDPGRNTYSFFWGKDSVVFWENCGYIGILPLALALFAIAVLFRRNRWVPLLSVAALVALLIAMGKQTPLFPLLWRYFPGMNAFRVAGRFLLIVDLSLAVLAGFGLDAVRARLAAVRPRAVAPVLALLFLLAAADLTRFGARHYALVDADRWFGPPAVAASLPADRDAYRVFTWHYAEPWLEALDHFNGWQRTPEALYPLSNALLPNYNLIPGFAHFGYYSGFTLRHKGGIISAANAGLATDHPAITREAFRLLGLYNVRYILSGRELQAEGIEATRTFSVPGSPDHSIRLYENPYALPRAYLAAQARVATEPREALGQLLSSRFDPAQTVLLDAEPPAGRNARPAPPLPPGEGVTWRRNAPGALVLEVNAPADAWLVLSDFPYPGWQASVDGRPVAIHTANLIGRAVPVPAGRHQVTFSYAPVSWRHGLLLSAVGLLLLLAAALVCRRHTAR